MGKDMEKQYVIWSSHHYFLRVPSIHQAPLTLHFPLSTGLFFQTLHDAFPHIFQVLFECPILSTVLPYDHLIYSHTSSPNPSLLVLLCYSLSH